MLQWRSLDPRVARPRGPMRARSAAAACCPRHVNQTFNETFNFTRPPVSGVSNFLTTTRGTCTRKSLHSLSFCGVSELTKPDRPDREEPGNSSCASCELDQLPDRDARPPSRRHNGDSELQGRINCLESGGSSIINLEKEYHLHQTYKNMRNGWVGEFTSVGEGARAPKYSGERPILLDRDVIALSTLATHLFLRGMCTGVSSDFHRKSEDNESRAMLANVRSVRL